MCNRSPSKAQGLIIGKQCPEIGGKIGKATLTSTAKASRSESPPATAAPWNATMLSPMGGRSGNPSSEDNSLNTCTYLF